jgi:protocatechuate 3,4-dioxygenase beta subunit
MLDLMQDTGDTMKAERVANVVYAAPPFGGSTLAELADVLYRDTVTPDTFSDPWMHQVLLQLGNKPVIREVLRFALTNPVAASLSAANAYLESAIVSKVDSILESFDAVANVLFGTSLDMSGTFLAANAAIADEVAPLSPVRGLCNAINFLKPIVTLLGGFPGYPKVRDDLRPYEAVHDNLLRWDANRLAQQFVIWGEAGLQGSGFHLGLAPSLEDAGENPASLHAFGTRSRNGTDFDELGTQADDGAVTRSSALALSDLAGGYMKALYGFKKQSHTTITEDLRLAEDNGTTVGEVLVETLLAPVTDLELVGPMGVVDPANRSYSVGATSTFVLKPEARTFYDLMGGRTFEVTPARVQYRVVKLPVAVDPVFGDWIDVDHRTFVGSFSALSHRYGLSGEQPFRLEWRSFNQNGGAEGIRSATFRIDTIAPSLTSKLVENPTNPMDTTQVYSRVSSARNTAAFRPDRLTPISSPLLSQIVGKTETEWVVNLAQDKRIKLAFDGPAKVEYAWDSPTLANARTVSTTTGPTIVTLPIRASGRTVGAPIGATFLTPGRHVLYFRAADSVGNATAIQAMTLFVDNQAPVLSMDASSLQIVGPKSVVTITADDAEVFVQSFQVTLAGVAVDIKNGRPFSMDQLDLTGVASGSTVSLVASATDRVGNTSTRTFSLVLDRNGPELNLDAVKSATRTVTQEWYTSAPTIEVFLSASDALAGLDASNGITWTVARAGTSQVALKQGELTATDKPGVFTGVIPLLEGASAFTARAIDGVGNQSTVSFLIHRQPALRVSVARGEIARDVDFANFHVGQLAGSVFDDRNANGLKDATEPNLGGSPVYLDLNRDGVHNPSEPLAVTDADGHYTFSQVGPGTYRVNVGADSLTQITAGAYGFLATARGGATVDLPAFGLARPGDVTGIVFHDSNGDGDRDAGELTFGGQLVYLDINGNQQLDVSDPRTNTNSSGAYSFNGLSVGSYVVRATRPAGFHFTAGGAGRSIQVLGGQITQSADFGFFKPISISGVVFNDLNGANGRQSGEPGLIGYKVFNDANGNGVQDTSEPTLVTSGNTAGIAGQFTVLNVLPGTLRLTVSLPSGWVATTPANGFLIDPVSGVNRSNVDLGLFKKTSINGVVSERTSPTNVQKAPGQTVFLDVNNNGLNDDGVTTVTSSQGAYSFNQLGPGPHRVRVELQPNWVKVDPTTAGHDVFPQSNTPAINKNFTLFRGATITGSVYNDQNGSRIRDAGEPAFDNWVVYLDANANNVQDTNETIARTGADGVYTFTGLAPAVHRVRQALPASFVQLTPRTSQQHNVTVTNGGQLVSQRDFGNRGNTAGFPFSDNFNRADNTDLGVNWEETFGNVEVRGNKMFRKTGSAAIAVYNGAAAADVMVQGDVDLNSADLNVLQRVEVGLVARYVGPTGPANTYVGVIVREKSKPDVAEIWSFSASGSKSVLASAPITAVRGRLSFTAMGRRLTLSLDDTELVTMEAESILGPGFVGVYLTKDRSIDNFNAQVPIGIGG